MTGKKESAILAETFNINNKFCLNEYSARVLVKMQALNYFPDLKLKS